MSTKKALPAGAPYAPPPFRRHRTKTKARSHPSGGILPFAIFNSVWYTQLNNSEFAEQLSKVEKQNLEEAMQWIFPIIVKIKNLIIEYVP